MTSLCVCPLSFVPPGCFFGARRSKGEHQRSSRPDESEGEVDEEEDANRTRAGHYLQSYKFVNIGPIDTL